MAAVTILNVVHHL